MAKDAGVDLTEVAYDGDRIRREDVRRHLAARDPRPDEDRRVPIQGTRKATAAAVTRSAFTAPHLTEFLTVDTATTELVETLRAHPRFEGVRVKLLLVVA